MRKVRNRRRPPLHPVRNEPGWRGAFTRNQAEGAIPNGTPIVKVNAEEGDAHRSGTKGTVLGSLRAGDDVCYFVEWEPHPRVAVGVVGRKIEAAS